MRELKVVIEGKVYLVETEDGRVINKDELDKEIVRRAIQVSIETGLELIANETKA